MNFAISIGLKVNYHKLNMYPINVPQVKIVALSDALHCQLGVFPFICLGFHIGVE